MMARLGDVCNIKSGYAFKSEMFTKNEIPIIRIGNITENGLEIDNDICFDESFWNKNKNYRINKDDVLVAMSGATVGKSCINKHSNKLLLNQRVASISGKNGVENKYVYYFVSSPAFMDYILEQSVGCAQPNISIKQLCAIEFYLPNLKEQKEIVGKLDKVYNLIALRREQLSKLDELVKARFVEMFGDPESNSKKWAKEPLSKHLNVVGGYAFKSELFTEEGIPVLRIGNINAGFFQAVNMVYWKKDDSLSRYMMYPGDLVMSLTGTVGKDDYGNVCVLGNNYESYYLNQRNAKLELFSSLDKYYLSQILKFPVIKKKLTGISRGVRQANISNKDILNLEIPIPPIELQNEFASFIKQIDKSKFEVQQSLEKLETLKKSLMQQYFG